MNIVITDGLVGKVDRRGETTVLVRINHKNTYFSKKENQWIEDNSWFSVYFFDKKAEMAMDLLSPGLKIQISGELTVYPKEGPEQRTVILANAFQIMEKKADSEYRALRKKIDAQEQ